MLTEYCSDGEANSGATAATAAAVASPAASGKTVRMSQAAIDWILETNTKRTPVGVNLEDPANARIAGVVELYWETFLKHQAWARSEYESKGFVESIDHSACIQAILDESDSDGEDAPAHV